MTGFEPGYAGVRRKRSFTCRRWHSNEGKAFMKNSGLCVSKCVGIPIWDRGISANAHLSIKVDLLSNPGGRAAVDKYVPPFTSILVILWKAKIAIQVAAIAPWFRLRLPSCGPGFESQAHHLCFFNYWNCNEKITKINKKRPGLAHF